MWMEQKRENWNLETILLNLFGCLWLATAGIFINKAKCLSDAVAPVTMILMFQELYYR